MSCVFKSKHCLSMPDDLITSVWINDSFSSSLLPGGPLLLAPHYSCLSTTWCSHMGPKCWLQLLTSSSLTTFDPLQKRISPCTVISLLFDGCAAQKPPGPVDMGIKGNNEGTDWEADMENNISCGWMGILANHHICFIWTVHAETDNLRKYRIIISDGCINKWVESNI